MITEAQKKHMLKQLEKADACLRVDELCDGLDCEDCPLDISPSTCEKERLQGLIHEAKEKVEKVKEKRCKECGHLIDC